MRKISDSFLLLEASDIDFQLPETGTILTIKNISSEIKTVNGETLFQFDWITWFFDKEWVVYERGNTFDLIMTRRI